MRSSPTAVCAIVFVILARSCTGLKNFDRYARNTVSAPTVIAPARISSVPRHSTKPVHSATTIVTTGESSDLMRRALQRGVDRRPARRRHPPCLEVLPAERLDDAHRAQPLLDDGDDVALPLAHLARAPPSPLS